MTSPSYVLLFALGLYVVAVLEGWASTGRLRLARPLRAGVALLGRETVTPRRPDRVLYETAPVLLLAAGLLAAAVLPLDRGAVSVDLATGVLFVNSALAYVMVGLVMAGWAPGGAYSLVAGWRFLGQLVAYSMLIVMPITAVAMRAQSLSTTAAVSSQVHLWNLAAQPLGFALFFLAAMAVCFLPPFDLPVSSDLAGGVAGEYTGARLAVVRLARVALVLTLSLAVVVFFLGGWLGPVLPGWVWTFVKTIAVAATMLVVGRLVPRLREEQVLAWGWKYGIPLALVNILWVGLTLLGVR